MYFSHLKVELLICRDNQVDLRICNNSLVMSNANEEHEFLNIFRFSVILRLLGS